MGKKKTPSYLEMKDKEGKPVVVAMNRAARRATKRVGRPRLTPQVGKWPDDKNQ